MRLILQFDPVRISASGGPPAWGWQRNSRWPRAKPAAWIAEAFLRVQNAPIGNLCSDLAPPTMSFLMFKASFPLARPTAAP